MLRNKLASAKRVYRVLCVLCVVCCVFRGRQISQLLVSSWPIRRQSHPFVASAAIPLPFATTATLRCCYCPPPTIVQYGCPAAAG